MSCSSLIAATRSGHKRSDRRRFSSSSIYFAEMGSSSWKKDGYVVGLDFGSHVAQLPARSVQEFHGTDTTLTGS